MQQGKKAVFLSSLAIDDAVLFATNQVDSLPVTNLQTIQPAEKYRSTGTTFRVDIDLGAGNELDCDFAAFIGHNGTATAVARIKGGDIQDEVSGVSPAKVDSGEQSAWPLTGKPAVRNWPQHSSPFYWENIDARRWWSFEWTDTANVDPAEGGRLIIGKALRPKFNISGMPLAGLVTTGVQRRSGFNRIYTDRRGPVSRRWDVPVDTINEMDMWDGFYEFQRTLGVTHDFYFCANPQETTYLHLWSGQFLFEDLSRFAAQLQYDDYGRIWQTSFGILELV